jgi:hypothetical protein
MPIKITELKPNWDKLVPESKKYDPLYAEIYDKYSTLAGETAQRITRNVEDKQFYLGELNQHWDVAADVGEDLPVVNYSHAVINKYADLLSAGDIPGVQVIAPNEDETLKAYASGAENLIYKILSTNNFARKLHYGSVNASMLGDAFFYVYWDQSKDIGGKKGGVVIESISPFFIRVGFAKDNWDDIDYWISETKMSPSLVKERWGIEPPEGTVTAIPGTVGGSNQNAPFDGTAVEGQKTYTPMVLVIDYHDKEKDAVLVGDMAVFVKKNKGNHGLYHIRNRTAPNEPWGYPDHYNIKDPNRILNKLYGQAKEIIESHAGPIIVDKGNVLGGKKLKTRHNIVVTTAPYAPGEGLEYLQWQGNIFPIDKQIADTTAVIHDLSEMPAAAFGAYQPGTTSGFQLTVQMQPTLMRIKIKQNAEWGPNIIELFRFALQQVLENDRSVGLPKEVADFEIKIRWPNPLPREDAKEIQNQILLTQNKLVSRETARQSLLIDDVVEEEKKIEAETLKEAEVMATAQAQAQAILQPQVPGMEGQPQMTGPVQPGQMINNNKKPPEEERATPQRLGIEGGESIAPTSKGTV